MALLGARTGPALACFDPAHVQAYLVATDGDDSAQGTPAAPFATIERALTAMRAGSIHTTFVRDGHYHLIETLQFDHRDDGVSVLACPQAFPIVEGADGLSTLVSMTEVRNAIWQGFDFVGGTGDAGAIHLTASSAVHVRENRFSRYNIAIVLERSSECDIAHNTVHDSGMAGIELKDRSDGNFVADNFVDSTRTLATHGGGIYLHGASGNRILRNQVQHTDGAGITLANWDAATINQDDVIAENAIVDVNRRSEDSGAIYVLGRSHVNTRTSILRNLIEGTGAGGAAHTIGIYLDDSTSGVFALGNRLRHVGTHAFEVHGGDDVTIEDNLLDLRSGSANAVLFQPAPADTRPSNTMQGNLFRRNLIALDGAERQPYSFLDGGRPAIEANIYMIPRVWSVEGDAYGAAPVFADETHSAPIDDLFRIWSGPSAMISHEEH